MFCHIVSLHCDSKAKPQPIAVKFHSTECRLFNRGLVWQKINCVARANDIVLSYENVVKRVVYFSSLLENGKECVAINALDVQSYFLQLISLDASLGWKLHMCIIIYS
jgi:hypothetical protein